MHHYAVTGNIGSGKSTVCHQFEQLGIPVYYADAAAKRLMHEDQVLISALKQAFGEETYLPDGTLNRPWLAKKVFSDDEALATLNGLVHPAVHRDADVWRSRQTAPYTLYEAAIVFELGRQDDFAGVIVVAASEDIRKTRVMQRDGVDEAAFAARAAKQWPDDKKEAAADFLIINDGRRLLLPQILRLHRKLTSS
ncbi:dephospho-CoA kinase [Neolewinella persica]|uniref:dephospho-CoA kinase n=1 Tax=Neolewinella persica TaxID=70998 RepID=UPI0003A35930|nr:dephospho-CoA kinase [Neolewinella persica]